MAVNRTRHFVLAILEFSLIAAANSLRCPDCTYMTTNVQVPLLKDIIQKIIDAFSDPVCARETVDPSISGIQYKTCLGPEPGRVTKCRHYRGQVTVKALGQELILNTFERGCYEDTVSSMPSDGCFQRENDPRDKSFFQTIVDRFNTFLVKLDVANFKGKMCICSSTESDCQNTSGSQCAILSTILLVVLFVSILFLK